MKIYKNKEESGIFAFENKKTSIDVMFRGGLYTYSEKSCGKETLQKMKRLSQEGENLCKFISKNRPQFESKRTI